MTEAPSLGCSVDSPNVTISSGAVLLCKTTDDVAAERERLVSPSQEAASYPQLAQSVRCIKCNLLKVPPCSSYFNNHEKVVQISCNQRISSAASTELPGRNRSAEEIASFTCAACRQKDGHCLCKDYWGIMLSLFSGLASTFGGLIVRHLKSFHPFSLATYRFQGILLPTLILVFYYRFVKKQNVFNAIWPVTEKEKLIKFSFTIVISKLHQTVLSHLN